MTSTQLGRKLKYIQVASMAVAFAYTLCVGMASAQTTHPPSEQDPRAWLRRVRIAAYSLNRNNAESIVEQATKDGVYGIEVDNDITGRYESLLDPTDKLLALQAVSTAAHQRSNKVFVYIAGLECISADDSAAHTLAKDHPQWLQRKITGEPAIFGTSSAFWIKKGEEDAWVSPYAADWRRLYMKRVAEIARTGVDGIYVDIPYWMTHFKGWEDSWASFDDATVSAFKQKTGLDARKDIRLGDFEDPGFQKWIKFRIDTITEFLSEIRSTAIAVNPDISVIPEIYPGIESDAPRVGPDVYDIYPVVDAVAHEYEFGSGDHTAAMRSTFDWMMYQIGIRTFRAFAEGKPTWILNYSWDGAKQVKPADAMQTMLSSELMAGANVWDASGHVMSGSNDLAQRRAIYAWIGANEKIFGSKQEQLGEIGVYFSDATRNRYADSFVNAYRGALLILLQAHRQFQIVTPRTLAAFRGKVLILPSVRVLDQSEIAAIRRFADQGGRVVIDGASNSALNDLNHVVRVPDDPAAAYLARAQSDYANVSPQGQQPLLDAVGSGDNDLVQLQGGKDVAVHAMAIDRKVYLFFSNFTGIQAGVELTPVVQSTISFTVPASLGDTMHVLPFLGQESEISGTRSGDRVLFKLPALERGTVVWFD